jgi:hypothetical protein
LLGIEPGILVAKRARLGVVVIEESAVIANAEGGLANS